MTETSKMRTMKTFLTVEHKETFNLLGEVEQDLKLNIDVKKIQTGLINQMGVYNFSVLVCIASHMDSKGLCFPSQRKISELTGISKNKVTSCVQDLLDMKVDGQPIIARTFAKGIKGKKTVYAFTEDVVEPTEIPATVVEETVKPKMTPKAVVELFVSNYQEVFGEGYIISWGRDMKLIKEKLIPNFTPEDIESIVKVAVNHYPKKWANAKYPRPTISMMCGWLGQEAWKIVLEDKKQEETFNSRVETQGQAEEEMDSFLNNL